MSRPTATLTLSQSDLEAIANHTQVKMHQLYGCTPREFLEMQNKPKPSISKMLGKMETIKTEECESCRKDTDWETNSSCAFCGIIVCEACQVLTNVVRCPECSGTKKKELEASQ